MGVNVVIILTLLPALALLPKARAGCSNSARPDPCGGPPARAVPTATYSNFEFRKQAWRDQNLKPRQGGTMGIIGWIFFGLLVGAVGKLLMPGRDPGGFVVTILLGIAGALIGGFLGRALGMYREDDPVGFIMAVLGSIVLLVLYRLTFARRSI